MSSSTLNKSALVERVQVSEETLRVEFNDGRSISLPLTYYPRLLQGSQEERKNYRLIGDGHGVHWPLLDEDLSAEGLLAGRRSMESDFSFQRWLKTRKTKADR
jgi:hypothetical protein